jgi:S1-C subfamily serine protease
MRLHQENQAILTANKLISSKSIGSADYSVFQVLDEGLLVHVHRGIIKQGGVNTDLVILYGVAKGTAGEGDAYKGDLYWCGNYSYISLTGVTATVNAYCLDKNEAFERVRATLKGETDNSKEDEGEVPPGPNSGPSDVPIPLVGAISSGSGFFVGAAGYFVTNAHVVEHGKKFNVFHSGQPLKAELIKVNKSADLALLKVSESVTGMEIAETDAELGEDVFAVGFPNPTIQGIEVKVTKGVISSSKGFQDDETRYQIDAAVQPGNSGGPLCNKSGQLVGVVVSGLNQIAVAKETGSIPQNVNYAIKASEIKLLLRQGGVSTKGAAKPQGVKSAIEATGLIIVR